MDDVCSKYCEFLAMDEEFDPSCRSHRLKERLSNYFGSSISFRRQRTMNQSLLLLPNVSSGEAIETLKTVTETLQETDTLGKQFPVSNPLHHVATK